MTKQPDQRLAKNSDTDEKSVSLHNSTSRIVVNEDNSRSNVNL